MTTTVSFRKREWAVALGGAYLLVFARFFVYLVYEQSFFDSDQAIVGLMAKHLVEGRAFPLFLYGQPYLLAIDAWVAAPFILIGGLTVAALRASAIVMSLVVVTLLMTTLVRFCRIRPLYALGAVVFFAMTPPVTAASLIEPGANTSPFLFVVILWALRDRPIGFGAVLGLAFLAREFTIYTVPALLIVQAFQRDLFRRDRLIKWAIVVVAAFAMWKGVQLLRPLSDPLGPGSRGAGGFVADSQLGNLSGRMAIIPSELPRRTLAMATTHFPQLLNARYQNAGFADQGHDWLRWPLMLALVAGLARALWVSRRSPPAPAWPFAAYLLLVGLASLGGYILTRPFEQSMERYYLFGLLVPIGIVAWLLAVEPRVWARRVAIGFACAWTALSASDYYRLAGRYWGGREANEIRVLADALVARHITVAKAGYWRAYKITFLTGERVKIASSDYVRIEEYQRLADEAGDALITIQEKPCPNGERVSQWYLCKGR